MIDGPRDVIEELLPGYALNALEPEDRDLVERALEREPHYQVLLAEYLETVAQLSASYSLVSPPASLRERMFATADIDPPRVVQAAVRARSAPVRAFWAVAAALVLAMLGLGSFSFVQQQRVAELEDEMESLVTASAAADVEMQQQEEELREQEAELREQRELAYILAETATTPAAMQAVVTPAPNEAPVRAMVLITADRQLYLMALNLRPLPDGRSYQAWLWDVEGQAHSVAVFRPDENGYALAHLEFPDTRMDMRSVSVNVERAGGNRAPTGQVVLAGMIEQTLAAR